MKKTILLFIPAVIGLFLICYPALSKMVSGAFVSNKVSQTIKTGTRYSAEEQEKMLNFAREHNRKLNTDVKVEKYEEILNIEDGIMGVINIDKIYLNLPIYHGIDDEVLRKGVGHIKSSAFPIGQVGTNSVLTSHSGLPEATLFTNIEKLQIGDKFTISILNMTTEYTVDEILVVEPDKINDNLSFSSDKCYVTLITCTPYRINTHRLMVRAEKTNEYTKEETQTEVVSVVESNNNNDKVTLFAKIMVIVSLIFVIKGIERRKKNEKKDN